MSLAVEHLSVTYGSRYAVQDVSLSVETGERFAVMGPSGSGKSTLLRAIAGLTRTTSGSITINGRDMSSMPAHRRSVGLMFQDYALFPHLTVEQNIRYGLRMSGETQPEQIRRSSELLSLVGLDGYGTRLPTTLSGGEQQRVALARTLAPEPSIVLLDEPLGSLDVGLRESLLAETRSILDDFGATAVYVTHDRHEAFGFCDRMAVIHEGRLVRTGRPDELWLDPRSEFVARAIGQTNLVPHTLVAERRDGLIHVDPSAIEIVDDGRHDGVITSMVFEDGRFVATIAIQDGSEQIRAFISNPIPLETSLRFDIDPAGVVAVSADEV